MTLNKLFLTQLEMKENKMENKKQQHLYDIVECVACSSRFLITEGEENIICKKCDNDDRSMTYFRTQKDLHLCECEECRSVLNEIYEIEDDINSQVVCIGCGGADIKFTEDYSPTAYCFSCKSECDVTVGAI